MTALRVRVYPHETSDDCYRTTKGGQGECKENKTGGTQSSERIISNSIRVYRLEIKTVSSTTPVQLRDPVVEI